MEEQNLKELYVQESLKNKALEKRMTKVEGTSDKYLEALKQIGEKAKSAILADSRIVNTLALREILHLTNELVGEKKDDERRC